MKTLVVMRHAKSSWQQHGMDDFERPLNDRGLKNAPDMAQRLLNYGVLPEIILHSAAVRTTKTAELVAKAFPSATVQADEKMYLASPDTLLEKAQFIDDSFSVAMVIAHNPGITSFINQLCNELIDNVVTAGIGIVTFECEHWAQLDYGDGVLVNYDYPKKS